MVIWLFSNVNKMIMNRDNKEQICEMLMKKIIMKDREIYM